MVASLCVEAVACEQAVGAKLVESVGTCHFLVASLRVEVVACEQAAGAKLIESGRARGSSCSLACVRGWSFVSKRWLQN